MKTNKKSVKLNFSWHFRAQLREFE